MIKDDIRHVYGPVPSRRLGRSLGIDLVPFKTCSYDCIYCQLGRTTCKTTERKEYVSVAKIFAELDGKLAQGVVPDYISLAGSGEPTLHSGLGELLRGIKSRTSIPVAVLTNGSLLWQKEVRDELQAADLVIPSLDAGDEALFQYVNRPAPGIPFDRMVEGTVEFTAGFSGAVWLEVFLLAGVTGVLAEAEKIAALARKIRPARIQLNTVDRPPGEDFAFPLGLTDMRDLKRVFDGPVDIIAKYAGGGSPVEGEEAAGGEEVLTLIRRRPCSAEDVAAGLGLHLTEAIKSLDALAKSGKAKKMPSGGKSFYVAVGSDGPGKDSE